MSTEEPRPEPEKRMPEKRTPAKRTPADPAPAKKKPDWKTILIGFLVFAALVGSLLAWLQGKSSRQPEVNALVGERDECNEAKSACDAARAELEARIDQLEARRQVSRAVEELVARNFGSAQDALLRAAAGLRRQGQTELASRIGEVELVATDDVGEQRDRLLALARDVDSAIGE